MNLVRISRLSNKAKSCCVSTGRDRKGRPMSAVFYQRLYGRFCADFIRENSRKIYLTLDEGYENGYSSGILDVLKEKQVSAVFFVTMNYAKRQTALIRRMIDEGHIIGSHSVTHPPAGMPSLSLERQLAEVREVHEYIEKEFGYTVHLFRPPEGIFSRQSLALVKEIGYRSVFWSFAYRDWLTDEQPDPEQAIKVMMEGLHPGAIYLLHAVSATNAQILTLFIDQAREKGYEFVCYDI